METAQVPPSIEERPLLSFLFYTGVLGAIDATLAAINLSGGTGLQWYAWVLGVTGIRLLTHIAMIVIQQRAFDRIAERIGERIDERRGRRRARREQRRRRREDGAVHPGRP